MSRFSRSPGAEVWALAMLTSRHSQVTARDVHVWVPNTVTARSSRSRAGERSACPVPTTWQPLSPNGSEAHRPAPAQRLLGRVRVGLKRGSRGLTSSSCPQLCTQLAPFPSPHGVLPVSP